MQYNFDTKVNRQGTNSLKWDVEENELPMWVADMDFMTAPEITSAILKRAETGIFGYTIVPDGWYQAIQGWWKERHHFTINKEWLIFCSGVIPAISSAIRRLTAVGENVLVQTPVYNIFFNSIENNGRHILDNRLKYDGKDYKVDFEDLEEKLANPQTTMMILCNPHNPIGIVWDNETLERIGELCFKHHVIVLSDEIHCDLTEPGYEYIPFASVSQTCEMNSITCISPTKTFNLAGIQTAAVMAPNEALRYKMERGLNTDEVAEPNAFAIDAAIAAFTKGEGWLDELRKYLSNNKKIVRAIIETEIPNIKLYASNATYLLWIDCSKALGDGAELCRFIRCETGLYLSAGLTYGGNGNNFLRMNIACPRECVEDALQRLKIGVIAYEKWVADLSLE